MALSEEGLNREREELREARERLEEHRRVEEGLRESEQQCRELIKHAPSAIYEIDYRTRRFISVNDAMCFLLGYSREELLAMDPSVLLDEEGQALLRNRISKWLHGEKPDERVEFRVRRKDGEVIVAELKTTFTVDEEGKPLGATVIAHDITERRRLEDALRESEENFRELSDASPVVIVVYRDNRMLYMNSFAANSFGYSRDELLAVDFIELMHPDDREMMRTRVAARMAGASEPARYELCMIAKGGQERWLDVSSSLIRYGGQSAGLVVGVDITERMRAEAALRESEANFRALSDASPVGVVVYRGERMLYVNANAVDTFGYSREEMLAMNFMQLVHPECVEAVRKQVAERMSGNSARSRYQVILVTKAGEERWMDISSSLIQYGGLPAGLVVGVDITERKRAEEKLRKREWALAQAGKMANVGAWDIEVENERELDANPLSWSDQTYRIMGYQPGSVEVSNALFFERVHPVERQRVSEAVAKAIAERRAYSIEHRIVRPDGEERVVEEHAEFEFDQTGPLRRIVGAIQDITERKRAEAELAAANRRLQEANEELRRFGSYLSHDLRAPLRTIRGFGEILQEDYAETMDEDARELVERMVRAANKASEIIRDIERLTGLDAAMFVPEEVNLREIAADWYGYELPSSVKAKCRLQVVGETRVRADRRLITVALTNLLENAVKFAQGRPVIEIEFGGRDGGEHVFYVRDNGVGFDTRHLEKIFMPFTRLHDPAVYSGTGLGLSIVRKVIERHGGRVWAESEVGKGATFYFTLGRG